MKARHILGFALGLALMAAPTLALAGVTNSVHDLPDFYNYTDAQAKQGACSFCHVPHKAATGGDRLFPVAYAAGLPSTWSSDSLSNICWYCHGAASGYASAVEVNPFSGGAHLRNTSLLTTRINPSSTDPADIAALAADLVATLTGTELRCVSCHKIHDNTVKPYLQWGTSGNFSGTATGFCGKCHINRSNTNTYGAGATNHPSNTPFADNTVGDSPVTGAALPTIMQVDMAGLATPLTGAWNLGGHALWTAGAEVNTMVCGTCHAVHNNETATWDAADGATPVGTAQASIGTPLLVAKGTATLAAELSAPICTACHSIAFGVGTRGPGAVGTFSHPVGTFGSVTHDVMSAAGAGYKWNTGAANDMIVCQSCHDIHWSGTNSTAGGTNDYLLAEQCNGCHSVAGTTLADHHPSNIAGANALVNGTATSETVAAGGTDWAANTQVNNGVNYWSVSTTMTCDTCHFRGAGQAHNNAGGFPGLIGRNTESDMCVDCHGFNPSTYTTTQATAGFTATHWTGGINTVAYKKTTAYAATGANAQYSPDGGANGSVICESCHSVAIVGKVGSPSGHTNSDVTAYATSLNTGDGVAATKDTVKLMLNSAGNMRGGFVSADNLCTSCHGVSPGGGISHPVLPNYTTNSTMIPAGNATTHLGKAVGQINCESCHRAHDADTDSNGTTFAWILEASAMLGTQVDYSTLCGNCHAGQY